MLNQSRSCSILTIIVSCFAILLSAEAIFACSSFCLQDEDKLVFAKNYDWHLSDGLVIVNKRGTAKRALLLNPFLHSYDSDINRWMVYYTIKNTGMLNCKYIVTTG